MYDYTTLADAELLTYLKESDHKAYTEIYLRHFQLVFSQAYIKLQDEDHAKDVVQDLFTSLWIKRENLPKIINLPGYLVTSIKNNIFNFFERQSVQSKFIESFKDYANTGNIAHTDYLLREREWEKYIQHAINSLPRKMKLVFELSKSEHLSNIEIARKLDTTESNISQHLSNATKLLKAKLGSLLSLLLL